jgi:hypothetical protein
VIASDFEKEMYEKLKQKVAEDGTVVVATCSDGIDLLKEKYPFYAWGVDWMEEGDVKIKIPFEAINEEWRISSRYDEIEILG